MTCPHAETQYFGDGVYRCVECGDVVDRPKIAFAPAADSRDTRVTRVDVIDHRKSMRQPGRVYSMWDVAVTLSYQDDGRTLKVFVDDPAASVPEDHK